MNLDQNNKPAYSQQDIDAKMSESENELRQLRQQCETYKEMRQEQLQDVVAGYEESYSAIDKISQQLVKLNVLPRDVASVCTSSAKCIIDRRWQKKVKEVIDFWRGKFSILCQKQYEITHERMTLTAGNLSATKEDVLKLISERHQTLEKKRNELKA